MAWKRSWRDYISHWWVPPRLSPFSHKVKGGIALRLSNIRKNGWAEDILYSPHLQSDSQHRQAAHNRWKSKKFGNASIVKLKDSNHQDGTKDRLGKNNILEKRVDWLLY